MTMNVFDLAQIDTRLKKVSHREYAGPCPGCGGDDRFHVQPDRKEGGAWMCRKCWPAESKGWADNIEYLRQFRHMSFTAAQSFLAGKVETAIERVERAHNRKLEQYGRPPNQTWQDRAASYAEQAQSRLWTPEGRAGLDYLRSRGLTDETIGAAHLGYAVYYGVPHVVIPWYADGAYWRINLRDIRPDIGKDQKRYHNIAGSSNAGLYLGDSLKYKRPVFMVEGELDALSIAQEAGDLVSVVATGTTTGSRTDKWVTRLAMSSAVLVAYDNDSDGDKAAKEYWLHVLAHNSIRYKPIFHKDANAMLVADRELVRIWVQSALDYLSDQDTQSVQAVASTQNSDADPEPGFTCSVCGIDLNSVDRPFYNPDGVAFCDYSEGEPYCSRGHVRTQPGTHEEFLEYARRLAAVLGPDCKVTPIEKGYTLEQHVKRLEQQAAEDYRRSLPNGCIKAG